MFKTSLRIDENSDLDALLQNFSQELSNRDFDAALIITIIAQSRSTAFQFIEQGKNLLNVGSSLTTSRSISGDGYEVQIQARFGTKPSLLSAISDWITRRG